MPQAARSMGIAMCAALAVMILPIPTLEAQDLVSKLAGSAETQRFLVTDNGGLPLFMLGANGKAAFGDAFAVTYKVNIEPGNALHGLRIKTIKSDAVGLFILNGGSGSSNVGIAASVASGDEAAVVGSHEAATGQGKGLAGYSGSPTGFAVYGSALAAGGTGVYGLAIGDGKAVFGQNQSATGWAGVFDGRVNVTGRLGINTNAPDAALHVNGQVKVAGGSPGAGKVLTSDADGLATWEPLPSPAAVTLDQAYDAGGAGAGRTINADAGAVTIDGKDGFAVLGGAYSVGSIPATGSGARMMWFSNRRAFRSGYVQSTEWDEANCGDYSTAMGNTTLASGRAAVALGEMTSATGENSVAIGEGTSATGQNSVAIGLQSTASGQFSAVYGYHSTASGQQSLALGSYAHAGGIGTFVLSDASTSTPIVSYTNNFFNARFSNGYQLYTNTACTIGAVLWGNANSWATTSDSTKKCAYHGIDGEQVLRQFARLRLGSWNYLADRDVNNRHYGAMAQEWYAAFGHDGVGSIGNDTTLASADVDGILCIAVKALERRTAELLATTAALREKSEEVARLREALDASRERLAAMEQAVRGLRDDVLTVKAAVQRTAASDGGARAELRSR